jgi:flagellin FlaB
MNSMKHADAGFTGLEAAIVLIAFVVVAAVFSYVVLGAGFFTTQKSMQVVHTGVQQASSTLEVAGNVYGVQLNTKSLGTINAINFSIALAAGGTAVDFDKVVLTYSNASVEETLTRTAWEAPPSAGEWSVISVDHDIGTNNHLLEAGEEFDITARPTVGIMANDQINLEIKPSIGPAFTITRTTPGALTLVNVLF